MQGARITRILLRMSYPKQGFLKTETCVMLTSVIDLTEQVWIDSVWEKETIFVPHNKALCSA